MPGLADYLAIFTGHQGSDLVGPAFKNIGEFEKGGGALARAALPIGGLVGVSCGHYSPVSKIGRPVGCCSNNAAIGRVFNL